MSTNPVPAFTRFTENVVAAASVRWIVPVFVTVPDPETSMLPTICICPTLLIVPLSDRKLPMDCAMRMVPPLALVSVMPVSMLMISE